MRTVEDQNQWISSFHEVEEEREREREGSCGGEDSLKVCGEGKTPTHSKRRSSSTLFISVGSYVKTLKSNQRKFFR